GAAPRQGTQARLREARFSRVVAPAMVPSKLSSLIPGSGVSVRFSPESRLRKHADFDTVYRNGRRLFSAHMTVFFLLRNSGGARIGFTIPRALGGAVVRNRIRGRMR